PRRSGDDGALFGRRTTVRLCGRWIRGCVDQGIRNFSVDVEVSSGKNPAGAQELLVLGEACQKACQHRLFRRSVGGKFVVAEHWIAWPSKEDVELSNRVDESFLL